MVYMIKLLLNKKSRHVLNARMPYVQTLSMSFSRTSRLLIDNIFTAGKMSSGTMSWCFNKIEHHLTFNELLS